MLPRVFNSGNPLAARIPKELALAPEVQEVVVERVGSTLALRRAHASKAAVAALLARFNPDFMRGGRLVRAGRAPLVRPRCPVLIGPCAPPCATCWTPTTSLT